MKFKLNISEIGIEKFTILDAINNRLDVCLNLNKYNIEEYVSLDTVAIGHRKARPREKLSTIENYLKLFIYDYIDKFDEIGFIEKIFDAQNVDFGYFMDNNLKVDREILVEVSKDIDLGEMSR